MVKLILLVLHVGLGTLQELTLPETKRMATVKLQQTEDLRGRAEEAEMIWTMN